MQNLEMQKTSNCSHWNFYKKNRQTFCVSFFIVLIFLLLFFLFFFLSLRQSYYIVLGDLKFTMWSGWP